MPAETLDKKAISREIGVNWTISAIAQMQDLHRHGMDATEASELIVRVCLAVGASVQATCDARLQRDFNRHRVRELIEDILSGQPVLFKHEAGQAGPTSIN